MDDNPRKQYPLYRGLVRYFPDALMEVAHCSYVANEQHNPGEEVHWAKEKSTDELDALMRHLVDAGYRDTDGIRHSTKVAWRALANLQRELEADKLTAVYEVDYEIYEQEETGSLCCNTSEKSQWHSCRPSS